MDSFGSFAAILPESVIAAILPETNLHAKSIIAAILWQYCQNMLQQYCCNIPPKALYFGKGNLVNYILIYMTKLKKNILIKTNENLKYLNDVSG